MVGDASTDHDELLEIAAHERRRTMIATLLGASTEVSLEELVDGVARSETDGGEPVPREVVRVELVHHHVPLLHRAELIDYDPERGVVEPRERIDRVADLLPEEILEG